VNSQFLKDQAERCRSLAAEAIKWTIRDALTTMAADFDRAAQEMDSEAGQPADHDRSK
jgi:hypothetical protein